MKMADSELAVTRMISASRARTPVRGHRRLLNDESRLTSTRLHPVVDVQPLYVKLTAGLLHGYKEPYEDKIPYNFNGFGPGILPAVGYCHDRYCAELIIYGTAGLMVTVGVTLP